MGKHSREERWANSAVIVISGKVKGSFWRVPTDMRSYTRDMMFGMAPTADGKIREVTTDESPKDIRGYYR